MASSPQKKKAGQPMSAQTTGRSLPSIQKPETGHRTATTPSKTGRSRNGSQMDSAITDGINDPNAFYFFMQKN
jgi:hypothetical protein